MPPRHFTDNCSRAETLWRDGVRLLGRQMYSEAAQVLRQSTTVDPSFAPAFNDLGVLMEALGNQEQALGCYQTALRAEPDHYEARKNLAALMLQMDLARALRHEVLHRRSAA
jgi:tetratricopeptide (TPR) repeat protein